MSKTIAIVILTLVGLGQFAIAEAPLTPKETCGIDSPRKFYKFKHTLHFISDVTTLEFTADGGFLLYSEEYLNHFWKVQPDNFTISYRTAWWPRIFRKKTFESDSQNWKYIQLFFQNDISDISSYVDQSNDINEIQIALNCARKIFINAMARGQEKYFYGQTSQQ
jgi:hypothetical protein